MHIRLTPDQAAALLGNRKPKVPGKRKYNNVPVIVDGVRYDSKAEHKRGRMLEMMVRAGVIRDLRRQVSYEVVPAHEECLINDDGQVIGRRQVRATRYVADFVYVSVKTGITVVEDVKGKRTEGFDLKAKLMKTVHGIDVRLVQAK